MNHHINMNFLIFIMRNNLEINDEDNDIEDKKRNKLDYSYTYISICDYLI